MARTMLDTFGDKDGLAREMFHWVPTTIFSGKECWGPAEVVSVPAHFGRKVNEWGQLGLSGRDFDNKI